jgi:glycosyltransferase involved in cell wall biosynthesis
MSDKTKTISPRENAPANAAAAGLGRASVVIACYNDADIVERNLAALARQSFRDFEVIIADDGSPDDYTPLLERWAPRFGYPLQHVRHLDQGFRKTRILNRAVLVSQFDRLIFVDMDCLPHRDFVRNHLRHLKPGMALAGRRVEVQRQDVPTAEQIWEHGLGLGPMRLLYLWLRGRANLIEHGLVLPFSQNIGYRGVLGCNFSAWKKDLQKINGFNAEYTGPGWEDTDIDYRLRLAGVRINTLRYTLVEYHVEHPVRVINDPTNQARLEMMQKTGVARAPVGLEEIREGDFEHRQYGD